MLLEVVACRTDCERFDLRHNQALLSPERLQSISQRPPDAQRSSVAGQWLLKQLLAEKMPELSFPPRFTYGAQEKPALADVPSLHFNVSHSGSWAVCALTSAPVGVDIQQRRPIRPALMKKLSPCEQRWLATLEEQEQQKALIVLWSLKESYCKCTGDGLRTPLNATAFTLSPVTIDRAGYQPLLIPFPDKGYSLAACVATEEAVTYRLRILSGYRPNLFGGFTPKPLTSFP